MKLIDYYLNATDKQRKRLMDHVDNMIAKERSPRKEKKKQKKPKRGAIRSPEGNTYYD
jgi:hypothetical protein